MFAAMLNILVTFEAVGLGVTSADLILLMVTVDVSSWSEIDLVPCVE